MCEQLRRIHKCRRTPGFRFPKAIPHLQNFFHRTYCAIGNHPACFKLLLDAGADPSHRAPHTGWTCAHAAAASESEEILGFLFEMERKRMEDVKRTERKRRLQMLRAKAAEGAEPGSMDASLGRGGLGGAPGEETSPNSNNFAADNAQPRLLKTPDARGWTPLDWLKCVKNARGAGKHEK